jgi:hypothetical protein
MRKSTIMAAIAAAGLLGTSAIAQTTAGGGVSASGPQGSVAGGASAGTNEQPQMSQRDKRRQGRAERRAGNSSSTYGAGSTYTDRNRATGAVAAGGTATGTGRQSSSTTVDAYGSTTRDGSTAEVYGDSTANSGDRPRN